MEEIKIKEFKAEELKQFEVLQPIDVSEFEGARVKIDLLEVIDVLTDFDETGKSIPGLQRLVKKLRISSEVLKTIDRGDGKEIKLRGTALFNLKRNENLNGEAIWGYTNHPNNKLNQFLKKMKTNSISELKGKFVTLTIRRSKDPNDTREYLSIVT